MKGPLSTLRSRPQTVPSLIAVTLLAVALTAAMSGGVVARSTFQLSPLEPTATPEVAEFTPEPPGMPEAIEPTSELPDTDETIAPTPPPPAMPEPVEPTPELPPGDEAEPIIPTAPDYLPPPTLTDPDSLVPGRQPPLRPNGQPPLVGPAAPPPEATPRPVTSDVPSPAQLIDNSVVALSYVWLCCGALALAGAAVALVWLARRSKRR